MNNLKSELLELVAGIESAIIGMTPDELNPHSSEIETAEALRLRLCAIAEEFGITF